MINIPGRETPFQYLKNRDGKEFDKIIVANWYKARTYVLEKLKDIIIGPSSGKTLKVIVEIDRQHKDMMLSVVRHLALAAHFANYEEHNEFGEISHKNCTTIVIVSKDNDIEEELKKEHCLNNLLKYCQYTVNGEYGNTANNLIPIDLDIVITTHLPKDMDEDVVSMTYEDVENVLGTKDDNEIFSIDTRKAALCYDVYNLGKEINNLPYEDIHNISRYNQALNVFQYNRLRNEIKPIINEEWKDSQKDVTNGLSNIFCADRFSSIAAGIKDTCLSTGEDETTLWEDKSMKLAISEHARWIVEKLIFGFRPVSDNERNRYEELWGNQRKRYLMLLKEDPDILLEKFHEDYSSEIFYDDKGIEHIAPAHINLCSFRELRRVDPDNRKYDSFLMLAIPIILDKIKE
jgi:hypothetical protein